MLQNRDKEEEMREHLTKIPAQYHNRVHYIAQYGMQVWIIWVYTCNASTRKRQNLLPNKLSIKVKVVNTLLGDKIFIVPMIK